MINSIQQLLKQLADNDGPDQIYYNDNNAYVVADMLATALYKRGVSATLVHTSRIIDSGRYFGAYRYSNKMQILRPAVVVDDIVIEIVPADNHVIVNRITNYPLNPIVRGKIKLITMEVYND